MFILKEDPGKINRLMNNLTRYNIWHNQSAPSLCSPLHLNLKSKAILLDRNLKHNKVRVKKMNPKKFKTMKTGTVKKMHKKDPATVSSSSSTLCIVTLSGMMLYTRIY